MNIGISTGCFFPQNPKDALIRVGEMGAKYVEIFFNTYSELETEYVLNLKNIADEYGMKIVSIHPFSSAIETFMFFSMNDYKLEDSIKLYEKYFKACNILDCKYVVFHGCLKNSKYMDMERYCHNLNKLSVKAREYGVYISQENVFKYKCGYEENLKEFIKYADKDIKFTFDIKQTVKSRQGIYRILNLVKDRINNIHISDYVGRNYSMVPFNGKFNYDKFFEYLRENTTAESAVIEVYLNSFENDTQLVESMNNLQKYS